MPQGILRRTAQAILMELRVQLQHLGSIAESGGNHIRLLTIHTQVFHTGRHVFLTKRKQVALQIIAFRCSHLLPSRQGSAQQFPVLRTGSMQRLASAVPVAPKLLRILRTIQSQSTVEQSIHERVGKSGIRISTADGLHPQRTVRKCRSYAPVTPRNNTATASSQLYGIGHLSRSLHGWAEWRIRIPLTHRIRYRQLR